MKNILKIAMFLTLSMVAGCGGGGGDTTPPPQPKNATLKLSISEVPGALTRNLSGVTLSVTLPDGVTPALDSNGSVVSGVVFVSGVAAPGTVLTLVYTPAAGLVKGKLLIPIAANSAAGFGAGEFATLILKVAAGKSPVTADYTLGEFDPIDLLGGHASTTGLTPTISYYSII